MDDLLEFDSLSNSRELTEVLQEVDPKVADDLAWQRDVEPHWEGPELVFRWHGRMRVSMVCFVFRVWRLWSTRSVIFGACLGSGLWRRSEMFRRIVRRRLS